MMRALTSAGAGMVAQQLNLDTIANNLANVNTTGFKAQRAEFQDLMYQTYRASGASGQGTGSQPLALQIGLGSQFGGTNTDFNFGALTSSSNPLDMAIAGEGFFKVILPNGESAYSRDGSFKVDSEGTLVTSNGYKVDPEIKIGSDTTQVTVMPDGTISGKTAGQDSPSELGVIKVSVFANPAGLTRIGQNLYQSGGASGEAKEVTPGEDGSGRIQGNALESSNVQIVEEMIRMITAQRAYEINSKAIQTADDMLSMLNQLKR